MHLFLLLAATISCPVLGTSTVAGALGEVQVEATEKTCTFTTSEYRLIVEMTKLAAPGQFARFAASACQGGREIAQIRAIGNEAVACSLGTGSETAEKIVSRVRNQAFTVFLTSTDKAADSKTVRSKNLMLAEQVAGNLF